jgi:hypothetical protein
MCNTVAVYSALAYVSYKEIQYQQGKSREFIVY